MFTFTCFRPLAGCEMFLRVWNVSGFDMIGFRPLAGCEMFPLMTVTNPTIKMFPSPCGV